MERHNAPIVVISYEYTVSIPKGQGRKFCAMVKELGGVVSRTHRRMSSYEKSLEDVRCGRVSGPFGSVYALFADLMKDV